MRWLCATYLPVSFFALRPSNVTASGGKTLLAPTPFAIKMALLSASLHTQGLIEGQRRFPLLHTLRIALALPAELVVIKTQVRLWRPIKLGASATREQDIKAARERGHYPNQPTIAAHEFVQYVGPLGLAFTLDGSEPPSWLAETLVAINYLGQRGSFLQLAHWPEHRDTLSPEYVEITRESTDFPIDGTLQLLDDWGATMTFDHADIYSATPIRLGKERIQHQVVLPYRLVPHVPHVYLLNV